MTRCHVCRTEIFSGKSVAHEDIQYEQACILYNLGELPASPAADDGAVGWCREDPCIQTPPLPPTSLPAPPFWATGSHLLGRGSVGLLPQWLLWAPLRRWPPWTMALTGRLPTPLLSLGSSRQKENKVGLSRLCY